MNDLKITHDDVSLIKERTRDQSENQHRFKLCQNRFTASMNNILSQKDPKAPRGFKTLANNLIVDDKKTDSNQVIHYKLSYGKFYKPIGLQKYEMYMKAINREVKVERCGLVIDHVNYTFGASPDGKVTDFWNLLSMELWK